MSISHYSYKYGHGSKEFSLESDRVIKERSQWPKCHCWRMSKRRF